MSNSQKQTSVLRGKAFETASAGKKSVPVRPTLVKLTDVSGNLPIKTAELKRPVVFILKMDDSKTLRDPANEKGRTFFGYIHVEDLPESIPSANLRPAQTDKAVHKKMRDTLRSQDGAFHEKNSGITIVADRAEWDSENKYLKITCSPGYGVLNGGHTYAICLEGRDKMDPGVQQWVPIKVITGLPKERIPGIAEALNSSVQVHETTLMALRGQYNWIQESLKYQPYAGRINYTENTNNGVDVSHLIRLMFAMDVVAHPIDGLRKKDLPMDAYMSKQNCLDDFSEAFEQSPAQSRYEQRFAPIINDILELHDLLVKSAKPSYNSFSKTALGKTKGGNLSVYKESRKVFFGGEVEVVANGLCESGVYAMMSALRTLLKIDGESGQYQWIAPFSDIKDFALVVLGPMVNLAQVACEEKGLTQFVRNPMLWRGLVSEVRANLDKLKNKSA